MTARRLTLAEALRDAGGLSPHLGAAAVHVRIERDGFYRCYLERATREESALFADSLDELLAPLASPRFIIPRFLANPPSSDLGALGMAVRLALRNRVGDRVVYHAVPTYLAQNRSRRRAFEAAWNRLVSPGRALDCRDPRAQAILEVQAGESPFATTSQIRTLWQ
jgi:hypothetical protein